MSVCNREGSCFPSLLVSSESVCMYYVGLPGLLPARKREDYLHIQGGPTRGRDRYPPRAYSTRLRGFGTAKASIDDAFIGFTRPVRAELLARYPYLSQVPPDAPHGLDTALPPPPQISLGGHGILIPVDPPPGDSDPTHKIGKDVEEDEPKTWHDVALSIAAELMDKIRAEVHTQLGYTTSAVSVDRL